MPVHLLILLCKEAQHLNLPPSPTFLVFGIARASHLYLPTMLLLHTPSPLLPLLGSTGTAPALPHGPKHCPNWPYLHNYLLCDRFLINPLYEGALVLRIKVAFLCEFGSFLWWQGTFYSRIERVLAFLMGLSVCLMNTAQVRIMIQPG